jgi:hypothetical protein
LQTVNNWIESDITHKNKYLYPKNNQDQLTHQHNILVNFTNVRILLTNVLPIKLALFVASNIISHQQRVYIDIYRFSLKKIKSDIHRSLISQATPFLFLFRFTILLMIIEPKTSCRLLKSFTSPTSDIRWP